MLNSIKTDNRGIYIPSIEELVMSSHNDLCRYRSELEDLKNNGLNPYNRRERLIEEINILEEILNPFANMIRDEKLKQIGI